MADININYKDSGVKTLRIVSYIVLIVSILVFAGCIFYSMVEENPGGILIGLITLFGGLFFFAIGLCVSTMAKNSLYQKEYIKAKAINEDIKFIDKTEKGK